MDNLTIEEIKDRLVEEVDPEILVEVLDITVEELVDAFQERVWVHRERLLNE